MYEGAGWRRLCGIDEPCTVTKAMRRSCPSKMRHWTGRRLCNHWQLLKNPVFEPPGERVFRLAGVERLDEVPGSCTRASAAWAIAPPAVRERCDFGPTTTIEVLVLVLVLVLDRMGHVNNACHGEFGRVLRLCTDGPSSVAPNSARVSVMLRTFE